MSACLSGCSSDLLQFITHCLFKIVGIWWMQVLIASYLIDVRALLVRVETRDGTRGDTMSNLSE